MQQILDRAADAPDSREAALILADALLEANDPYGEFIVRSVRGEHEQARELKRRHERRWLGPLRRFFGDTEYRLGLLYAAELARDFPANADALEEALDHPMLGVVRRLWRERSAKQRINRTEVEHYARFVCAPLAKRLTEVDGSDVAILDLLIDGAAPAVSRLADVRLNRATLQRLARPELDRIAWLEVTVTRQLADALEAVRSAPAFANRRRAVQLYGQGLALPVPQAIEAWPDLNLSALALPSFELRRDEGGTVVTLRGTGALGSYLGDFNPDPYWASLMREQLGDLRKIVFAGGQPIAASLAMARSVLPHVRFEMADDSEPVGREPEQMPVRPERPAIERPEIPPQPPSDPDSVTTLILRGELAAAIAQYRLQYRVEEELAVRKVTELQKLLRPVDSLL